MILKIFGKSSEIFGSVRKFWKTSETVQKSFSDVFMIFKIFGKYSEIFGSVRNLRKFLENFGNGSKVIFRCCYDFLKFSENLRKSSAIFSLVKIWKISYAGSDVLS